VTLRGAVLWLAAAVVVLGLGIVIVPILLEGVVLGIVSILDLGRINPDTLPALSILMRDALLGAVGGFIAAFLHRWWRGWSYEPAVQAVVEAEGEGAHWIINLLTGIVAGYVVLLLLGVIGAPMAGIPPRGLFLEVFPMGGGPGGGGGGGFGWHQFLAGVIGVLLFGLVVAIVVAGPTRAFLWVLVAAVRGIARSVGERAAHAALEKKPQVSHLTGAVSIGAFSGVVVALVEALVVVTLAARHQP